MIESTYYFDHDYDAANDDKMLVLFARYGDDEIKAYGAFWRLAEAMVRKTDTTLSFFALEGLAPKLRVTHDWLKEYVNNCLDIGLFVLNGDGGFTSLRLLGHKEFRAKNKQAKQEAGRRGGISKAINSGKRLADASTILAPLQQNLADDCQAPSELTKGKESIGKESKGESIIAASPTPSLFDNNLLKPNATSSEGQKEISKEQVKKFVEPTVEEIAQELIKRNIPNPDLNAKKFHASYAQKGWVMNNGKKMKSWSHAITNWETSGWFNAVPQMGANGMPKMGRLRF